MALIAVVNDDTAFIELMADLLSEEGYDTIVHKVGDTAYDLIRERMPNLVVLDIRMQNPDSGWIVLDLMRLDPQTTDIPVIICSADVRFLHDKQQQLTDKGCCVLEKPFRLDELLTLVAHVLDPVTVGCEAVPSV